MASTPYQPPPWFVVLTSAPPDGSAIDSARIPLTATRATDGSGNVVLNWGSSPPFVFCDITMFVSGVPAPCVQTMSTGVPAQVPAPSFYDPNQNKRISALTTALPGSIQVVVNFYDKYGRITAFATAQV